MPIYEYLCEGCAYKFEVKQSIKDEPLATCDRCGKSVKRLISNPAIMFKGTGWYITDYSDKLKPPSAGEKTESAPADKQEPAPAASPPSNSTGGTSSPPASSGAQTGSVTTSGSTSPTPPASK